MLFSTAAFSQVSPPIEPGVSQELAKWRGARYSDVRYKLNLTLEKMSPVLKGTMEIRVNHSLVSQTEPVPLYLVLDWRKIRGHENLSTISNVKINGLPVAKANQDVIEPGRQLFVVRSLKATDLKFYEQQEHLIFSDGVDMGENVITLDFTSPILLSGSAITRYMDKEDGAEYIYSLFVPSDASTAFPVFDQPDLKARFLLSLRTPSGWNPITNTTLDGLPVQGRCFVNLISGPNTPSAECGTHFTFHETKPISTYVFAFAAGPFERVEHKGGNLSGSEGVSSSASTNTLPTGRVSALGVTESQSSSQPPATAGGTDIGGAVYVRKSQAAKFKPHAAEVFRLNREAVTYFEQYFDYKFPFPKYDLVLIPEFPFGGMEHAGATFLREASIIFPQEPTKNDHINRAQLIFHEAAHQWFGDTVTMRWFDDLWLKEGFATFTAYKAMEKIMPEANAWKVFYERIKQGAYQTDSTRGTTPIYQEIKNLSAAKSAYGNIVYNKAPAFLRQAEFYLGEDKFRTAVRAFLKKHEFGNAGWEDLVREFETSAQRDLKDWAKIWVRARSLPTIEQCAEIGGIENYGRSERNTLGEEALWTFKINVLLLGYSGEREIKTIEIKPSPKTSGLDLTPCKNGAGLYSAPRFGEPKWAVAAVMPNYDDFGYGIFLPDRNTREFILKNIQNEKDPFLRSMMWGALWDSVREGELDPREYVELVVRVLSSKKENHPVGEAPPPLLRKEGSLGAEDESTMALLLSRVGTALNYYIQSVPPAIAGGSTQSGDDLRSGGKPALQAETGKVGRSASRGSKNQDQPPATAGGTDIKGRVESLLIGRMRTAETLGERVTYYRAFLNAAGSENARRVLKDVLNLKFEIKDLKLRTKDKFDIVTKLLILGDAEAPALLAQLEKTETSDEAKRYAYAARAGIGTAENKARYWKDFTENKDISESWIEAAFGPWNSIRHSDLTLPYLERTLRELPNHKRNRKIFFVNGWLGAFIGGQRSEEALGIVNKFLAENPNLDRDLRLKILENVDLIERAVKIRKSFPQSRKGA